MVEQSFDRHEKYVESVHAVNEAEALSNWQAIEAGHNDCVYNADIVLTWF
jgi:hypothetical protein